MIYRIIQGDCLIGIIRPQFSKNSYSTCCNL
nr:MAG TPA: hypothetical protein [Caudoviricetes sp.]